ncbi:hypothetical protein ABT297_06430 [Dactylosporangium sp. NPDC000555]|uniref:hypothetical protein n=1 Tax=Dactylosporangium sp. NPDC000555 TaxID=3154260 RepID=UPI0033245CFA
MAALTKPKRACIYCRISENREGLEHGVASQEDGCQALAAKQGYLVAGVHIENDVSAGTLGARPRPVDDPCSSPSSRQHDVIMALTYGRPTRRPLGPARPIKRYDESSVLITTVGSGANDRARRWPGGYDKIGA